VKSEDEYWIKVQDDIDNIGYINYSMKGSFNNIDRIENAIEEFGIYHINLLTYNEFDVHPEYQGFLMALADEYDNLDEYINAGYPFDGFTFMGICAGESSATSDGKSDYNLKNNGFFGSTLSIAQKYQNVGDNAVIDALIKCNLAFSKTEAKELMNDNATIYPGVYAFYHNSAKFIGHLELRLRDTERTSASWYEPSNNHTSYLPAVANSIRWENARGTGKRKGDNDYRFFSGYDYTITEIIDIVGLDLVNKCQFIKDGTLNPNYTGYGNPSYEWWWK
jgi:hypothetical protein